jgi:hypothetical protein
MKINVNIGKLKRKTSSSWLAFSSACREIKSALYVEDEVAAMILQGLVATGNVHACDDAQQLVDLDECTITEYENRVAFVEVDDLRYWLSRCTRAPQPALIDAEIAKRRPRRVPWKQFCNEVRDACNGWQRPGKPALGFSTKQIQRRYNSLVQG